MSIRTCVIPPILSDDGQCVRLVHSREVGSYLRDRVAPKPHPPRIPAAPDVPVFVRDTPSPASETGTYLCMMSAHLKLLRGWSVDTSNKVDGEPSLNGMSFPAGHACCYQRQGELPLPDAAGARAEGFGVVARARGVIGQPTVPGARAKGLLGCVSKTLYPTCRIKLRPSCPSWHLNLSVS